MDDQIIVIVMFALWIITFIAAHQVEQELRRASRAQHKGELK